MAYRPVRHISFCQKKHRNLLWIVNRLAEAYNEEAAVIAGKLITKAGNEELERLGVNPVSGF